MKRTAFGSRGEGWVVVQFTLLPLLLAATWLAPSGAPWPLALGWLARGLGAIIAVGAAGLFTWGVAALGRNLTPNPKPLEDGHLVRTGAYALVRHPIYAGVIFGMLAIGLFLNSIVGLLSSVVLFIFFDLKSRREERWLREKYPEYADYCRRTRKLIPFVY
ncbi:MAG: isoprenylcysteine carboxylmethyltransferase family protein [Chloroflexi bacterium]|jgi:protein-S-isoprenylcysteine O-methyltransferase Ste14|uniref:Isoprenylcysteine carboxylmethyltransferase family protein n=1 Tax=Candidatus Thermofonsia Clade 3 bacterium TaxID=2364212 RepID=A0A2M8QFS3_9CHLR|nr:isoprenylcysteine carboxylmethyltransferase family protein [Candidatus Roseilinea sp. NK_OTU-006]PJF48656.1 MAG: isoprenylcysteine carboxylmethyltransferase family protein [Candidatus Thermofonsia Clade 3 bacterium]RMG63280.1 MAG: isoprenylcysteine carboxylmethyltransferase family protein [Chloroflexota bacterium]